MSKKKKVEEDLDLDMEDDLDYEEDLDMEDDLDNARDIGFDDETPVNPMGLASQISKESDTSKQFRDLPSEIRYSFLDINEKNEVKHHARAYRGWKYIEKIITLRATEDENNRKIKSNLKSVTTIEQFIKYLKDNNKEYMVQVLKDFDKEDFDLILKHIKNNIEDNYMLETIENNKKNIKNIYTKYNEESNIPSYIDDMDNLGKVVDTGITSMGYKGNAAQHSVMTIQAVKNEDIEKKSDDKSSFSLLDAIKRRVG